MVNAGTTQQVEFNDDAPTLKSGASFYSDDGVVVGVELKFSNATDFRFQALGEELAQTVASMASAQEHAQRLRFERERRALPPEHFPKPVATFIPSRIAFQRSPEGFLHLLVWGEASEEAAAFQISPERAREMHTALNAWIGNLKSGGPW